jgi:hypothetical protein
VLASELPNWGTCGVEKPAQLRSTDGRVARSHMSKTSLLAR